MSQFIKEVLVDAIQYTGINRKEVNDFCRRAGNEHWVGLLSLLVGDWITSTSLSLSALPLLCIHSDYSFKKIHTPVKSSETQKQGNK